jgi:anaerobic nitric oxide reductase transcription regulator
VTGVLAADALAPGLFDALDRRMLSMLAALASAAMRTIAQFDALEEKVERRELLVGELQRRAAMSSGGEILGTCPAMQRLREEIALVAPSHLGVLITGETGVGKALVAHSLHQGSSRRNEAMVHVNCAALPESLVESELFGHVAGAFTGAQRARAGKFEIADGGTLFLDEIGELPPAIQAKLLHVLEHGRIQRVGSDLPRRVDVRVVAATNRDLPIEVATGRFRSDLYHRLAVYPIHVPPLRDRREDIPQLVTHFAELSRRKNGFGPIRVSEEALARLAAADWPGNVRELANVIDRAVLRASRNLDRRGPHVVRAEHVDADGLGSGPTSAPAREDENGSFESGSLHARIDGFRRAAILAAVEDHRGSWAAAARSLGMDRSNLHHLAKRLGLIR